MYIFIYSNGSCNAQLADFIQFSFATITCHLLQIFFFIARYGAAPNTEQVKEFQTLCARFFKDHPEDIVGKGQAEIMEMDSFSPSLPPSPGVHCTHGFNRTGFLIVTYLIDVECWE